MNNFPIAVPTQWLPIIVIWSLIWKGFALWHASKRNEAGWFIALLILNTMGILEIVYLAVKVKSFNPWLKKLNIKL
jgi:hypothetical protein